VRSIGKQTVKGCVVSVGFKRNVGGRGSGTSRATRANVRPLVSVTPATDEPGNPTDALSDSETTRIRAWSCCPPHPVAPQARTREASSGGAKRRKGRGDAAVEGDLPVTGDDDRSRIGACTPASVRRNEQAFMQGVKAMSSHPHRQRIGVNEPS
jgi:hypothetical protein